MSTQHDEVHVTLERLNVKRANHMPGIMGLHEREPVTVIYGPKKAGEARTRRRNATLRLCAALSFLPWICLVSASFLPHLCLVSASSLPRVCLVSASRLPRVCLFSASYLPSLVMADSYLLAMGARLLRPGSGVLVRW